MIKLEDIQSFNVRMLVACNFWTCKRMMSKKDWHVGPVGKSLTENDSKDSKFVGVILHHD